MGLFGFNFNLKQQLAFYGAYHQHPGNQAIHFFFVPLIFWSVMVWLEYLPQVSQHLDLPAALSSFLPDSLARLFVFNWSVVLVLLYGLYYTILEPFAGASWTVILGVPKIALARLFYLYVPHAWAPAIGLHLLGWVVQIWFGHHMMERKRPALLDSLLQSLVLAGLFAWMEGLFALGYRPKLKQELKEIIRARCPRQQEPLLKTDSQGREDVVQ